MKLLPKSTWNRFAVIASAALTLLIVLGAMFDREPLVRSTLGPVVMFALLSSPAWLPLVGILFVVLALLAVRSLVAMLGRIHRDSQSRRDLMLRGLCAMVPLGVWKFARVTNFADLCYIARHRECLEAAVEGRPAAHAYEEVFHEGRCTVIFATNYSISDVYWVIHVPPEVTAVDRASAGRFVRHAWHVEGPWYAAFR